MKKLLFLFILLAPLALVPAAPAHACSAAADWPPSIAENLATKDAAFIGTVKSVMQDKSTFGRYHITFAVEETYKGFLGETVTVAAESSSATCGYDDGYGTFKPGTVWAIYATGNAADGYHTDHLSLNTKYDSVAAAKEALAKAGIEKEEPLMCTMEYAPVCGRTPDGKVETFGNGCMLKAKKAVKLYDGECRPDTAPPARDLMFGSQGGEVTWLQKALISASIGNAASALANVGPTGYFGPLTRAALAEFQKARGIAPAFGYFGPKTRAFLNVQPVPKPEPTTPEATTFTGTLSAVDTACFADGVCSATVDGKEVILLAGYRIAPVPVSGTIMGVDSIGDLEDRIGSQVQVRAAVTNEEGYDYTLYGSSDYYLKVLD